MNKILSDKYPNKQELEIISEHALELKKQNKIVGNHIWIKDIDSSNILESVNKVRNSKYIIKSIQDLYPGYRIKQVDEVDEIYFSISPLDAVNSGGSTKSLVDCHYDSPFYFIPDNGIIFYRIILACNPNNSVSTSFPDNKIKVEMDNGDFHGFDFNKDRHCVDGIIPENKHRILLKIHFLLIPSNQPDNSFTENYIRYINVLWYNFSRNTITYSSNPETIGQYLVANIVNYSTFIFNYFCVILLILILILVLMYRAKK